VKEERKCVKCIQTFRCKGTTKRKTCSMECSREYNIIQQKAYRQQPKIKAKQKAYRQQPKIKAKRPSKRRISNSQK